MSFIAPEGENSWDELCLLCGISPNPPRKIYPNPEYGAQDLADKLIKHDSSILVDLQLERDALVACLRKALTLDQRSCSWEGFTSCVAVGHFDKDGYGPPLKIDTESSDIWRIADGENTKTYLVEEPICGNFRSTIQRCNDGYFSKYCDMEAFVFCSSSTPFQGDTFGNFFLSEACFYYLQAWIDQSQFSLGSRAEFLTFAGELYEVVNSRKRGRVNGVGTVPWIDYGGMEDTLEQKQSYFQGGLKVPNHTAAAIRNKSTPQNIFDAIVRDCGRWKFEATNSWPFTLEGHDTPYGKFSLTPTPLHSLESVPSEIFLHIFSFVDSIQTYLSLAKTTKRVYNILTDHSFLSHVIKEMSSSPSGCLFWLLPVPSVFKEVDDAYMALSTFLPGAPKYIQKGSNDCQLLFARSDFPWIPFVRACYASDSMMNRKRIWGQIKQLEEVWKDYRLHGWEVDRFSVAVE